MPCLCADFEWPEAAFRSDHHPLCAYDEWFPVDFEVMRAMVQVLFPDQLEVNTSTVSFSSAAPGISVNVYPLVSLAIGGIVEEGDPIPLLATSELAAMQFFWQTFRSYAFHITAGQLRGFQLVWRELPHIYRSEELPSGMIVGLNQRPPQGDPRYSIWARLVIVRK